MIIRNYTRRPGYTRPIWMTFFSQNLDYFRPYKTQIEPGYKGHPIELMVNFLDHLGPFGNIEDREVDGFFLSREVA